MGSLVKLALIAFAVLPGTARAQTPDELGAQLAAALDAMLALEHAEQAARVARLAPAADATLDYEAFAAELLGEAWGGIPAEERAGLARALRGYLLASLAARLELAGEEIEVRAGPGAIQGERARVELTLRAPFDVTGTIGCELARGSAGFRVVDLEFDGQSLAGSIAPDLRALLAVGGAPAVSAELDRRARLYASSPGQIVASLQDGLIEVMRAAEELGFAGRFARLAPLVDDTHDLAAVAKLVVSRQWKELPAEQREELTRTFRELAIATYAARFDGYGGERFEGAGEERVPRGALVKSRLVLEGGAQHLFEYSLRLDEGRWRIVNITVDGVSDLALKRQEYGDVIAEHGFAALIVELQQEIARYRAGGKD